MANQNFNPNARYDNGPSAAGSGRQSLQATLNGSSTKGLQTDGTVSNANVFAGLNCAGASRNNIGPNVAGADRSISDV